jgi:hypothetical protein
MRWPRANLEEKQEPRVATSASAERRAEGMWHDVTRKGLTEAAIEKRTFRRSEAKVRFVPEGDIAPCLEWRRTEPLSSAQVIEFYLPGRDRMCLRDVAVAAVPF